MTRKTGVFKGDTIAKKLARLETWQTAHDLLGEKRFNRGPHLFLAGPLAPDMGVAMGLGASSGELIAVDQDANVAESAQWRWSGLDVRHEDATSTVANRVLNKIGFNFIFLDFCAQMKDDNIDTVGLALVEGLNTHGVLAAAFQASREMPEEGEYHREIMKVRSVLAEQIEQMPQPERDGWEPLLPALARFPVFRQAIIDRTSGYGMVPVPVSVIFYKSKKKGDHHGMGMCCFIMQGKPCEPHQENDPNFIEAMTRRPKFYFIDPTPSEFGLRVDAMARHGQNPALLLDLGRSTVEDYKKDRSTVGAYRANATRGTYRDGRAYAKELRATPFSGYWPGTYESVASSESVAPSESVSSDSKSESVSSDSKSESVALSDSKSESVALSDSKSVAQKSESDPEPPVSGSRAISKVPASPIHPANSAADRIYLSTDDEPCHQASRGYDLAGTERHDVMVVRVVGRNPQRGYKWLCLCLACGRSFCRYAGEIVRRLKSDVYSFSCGACSQELRAGRLLERTQPGSDLRKAFLSSWQEYGSLYSAAWEESMTDVLREEFYRDEPWPLEQITLPIYTEPLGETKDPRRKSKTEPLVAKKPPVDTIDQAIENDRQTKAKAEIVERVDTVWSQLQVAAARQSGQDVATSYLARLQGIDLEKQKQQQLEDLQEQFPVGSVVDVTFRDGRVYRSVVREVTDLIHIRVAGLGRSYNPQQIKRVEAGELSTYDGKLQRIQAKR
jgi:hypothetical protein